MTKVIEFLSTYGIFLWQGIQYTLTIALVAVLLSILTGTLLAMMRISKHASLRWAAATYIEIVRGIPVLVHINICYFGLPLLGIPLPSININGVPMDAVIAAVVALTINSTAYVCEIIRSGIQAIDGGQMEASRSLGFNYVSSMWLVVLPQAVKNILPSLGNQFANTIKESSQCSVIGIAELMYAADKIRGISYKPFAPILAVACIYLVITFSINRVVKVVERNMKKDER